MLELLLLLLGLAGLLAGSSFAVDHGVAIARHYHLSDLFVGIAILAFGTDLPELVIALNAGIKNAITHDTSGLVLGNSIGSCFGQIGLILGVVGLLGELTVPRRSVLRHGGVACASVLVLFVLAFDGEIDRLDGLILIAVFGGYLFILFGRERVVDKLVDHGHAGWRPWLLLAGSIAVVIASAELAVRSAVALAEIWGVKQSVIAIVILGLGSSLPELAVSIAALKRGRHGMSIGNLLGSNIFDTLIPIGLAALIYPLYVERGLLWFDIPALGAITLAVVFFFWRKRGFPRTEAMALVALYLVYILAKIIGFGEY